MPLISPDTGETRIGDSHVHVMFNTRSISLLEERLGGGMKDWLAKLQSDGGITDVIILLWGSMEGYRRRESTRPEPFTEDDAANLMDEVGIQVATEDLAVALMHSSALRLSDATKAKAMEMFEATKSGEAATEAAPFSGTISSSARAGIAPDRAWNLTPGEVTAIAVALHLDAAERADAVVATGWWSASLSRAKRVPPLRRLLRRKPRRHSDEERARYRAEFEEIVALDAQLEAEKARRGRLMGLRELLGTVIVEGEFDGSKIDKGLGEMEKEVESKSKGVGQKLGSIGETLTSKVTPAAAGIAVASGVMAQSWNNAQRDMAATTGFTGQRLEDLSNSVTNVVGTVKGGMGGVGSVMAELAAKTELAGKPLEDLTRKLMGLKELGMEVTVTDVGTAFGRWAVPTDQWGAALERLLKVSQATGVPVTTLLGRLAEFQPVLQDLGFNFDQASLMAGKLSDITLPGLKKALATIIATGTTDVPGAFNAMIGSIRSATTETEALSLGTEYFGAKAAPALVDAIRSNKFELSGLTAEVEANKGSIMGTVEAHRTWFDQIMLFKDQAAAALGPYAEKVSTVAQGIAAIGPAFEGISKGWEVAKAALGWVQGLGGAATAAGAGMDVMAVGTAASGAASGAAAVPTASFGAALLSVLWPVLAVIAAVIALVAIFWFLHDQLGLSVEDTIRIMLLLTGPFGVILNLAYLLWENWDKIWGWIAGRVDEAVDWILGRWDELTGAISGVADAVWNVLKGAWDWIIGAAKDIVKFVGEAADAVADFAGKAAGGLLKASPIGLAAGALGFDLAQGGVVPGPKGAPVFGVAHGGELILSAAQAGGQLGAMAGSLGGADAAPARAVVVHNHIAGSVVTERQLARTTARTTSELRRWGLDN